MSAEKTERAEKESSLVDSGSQWKFGEAWKKGTMPRLPFLGLWLFVGAAALSMVAGFRRATLSRRTLSSTTVLHGFPRPIHKEFKVEKASPELIEELGIKSWPTWSTAGSPKYKVGIKSPLKVSRDALCAPRQSNVLTR